MNGCMDGRIRNQAACVPFYQNAYKMSWDCGWKPFLCTPWRQLNASLGFCSAAMSSGSALWILDSYDRQSTQRCKRSAKTYGRCKGAERTVCVARETSQAFHGLKQALDDARSVKESREMGALLATGSTDKGISMQMSLLQTEYSSIVQTPLPLMFCTEIRILQTIVMNHGVGLWSCTGSMLLDKGTSNLPVARWRLCLVWKYTVQISPNRIGLLSCLRQQT